MNDFLNFRQMVTPTIIQVLFWLGAGAAVLTGLVVMFSDGALGFLLGLAVLAIGPLAVRIYCELLILLFRMNETLTDIRTSLVPGRD